MTSTPSASHLRPVPDPEVRASVRNARPGDAAFDDLDAALAEAARVLKPGGRFVYAGTHPCFGSPMVARGAAQEIEDAVAILRPGYTRPGCARSPLIPRAFAFALAWG
jgi:SAM-dependent methyltransferase